MPMPLIPDMAVFQRKLATLPLATYQAGETVLSAASTTGRLLILKEGAVAVVKEGVEIARVTELQADCLAGVWAHHSQQKWKGGQT
jgi:CRP/FNR family transcriptional regulator, cyclic AMP receptor protein